MKLLVRWYIKQFNSESAGAVSLICLLGVVGLIVYGAITAY